MISLRLVLDTNVIVSSALNPSGLERMVMRLAMSKPAKWYVSPAILSEYANVIARPELDIRKGLRRQFQQTIKTHTRSIKPSRLPPITPDLCDNMFVECADASRADYLITGNIRDFPRFWKMTKIVNSREFLTIVTPHLIP